MYHYMNSVQKKTLLLAEIMGFDDISYKVTQTELPSASVDHECLQWNIARPDSSKKSKWNNYFSEVVSGIQSFANNLGQSLF